MENINANEDANQSVESMSLCSISDPELSDGEELINVITNTSFMQQGSGKSIPGFTDLQKMSPESFPLVLFGQTSPMSSTGSFTPPTQVPKPKTIKENSNKPKQYEGDINKDIAYTLDLLGIKLQNTKENNFNQGWLNHLTTLISNFILTTPREQFPSLERKLKKYCTLKDGTFSASLPGLAILKFHSDLQERPIKPDDVNLTYLPNPIQFRLYYGHFVPIRHIIYSEALILGIRVHMVDGKEVDPNPYPLHPKRDLPPIEFLSAIRRPEILKGITTHSLALGSRFPMLAAKMHIIERQVWDFLYRDMFDLQLVMDIYDEYFKSFHKQMNNLVLLPLEEGIPKDLVNTVKARHSYSKPTC